MAEAIRTQIDGLNEQYSWDTALDCSDLPDMARQEFKDETDVNIILARYGVDGLKRDPTFGEIDFDVDLQQSLNAISTTEAAVENLPQELRDKYPTWLHMLRGVYSGSFKRDLETQKANAAKAAIDAAIPPAVDSGPTTDPRD